MRMDEDIDFRGASQMTGKIFIILLLSNLIEIPVRWYYLGESSG